MIEEGNYKNYKKKLLTGIHIIANIYEGITQGISQAGTGLAKGTTQVVGAKYGKDAGEATENTIEGVRNVYKIMDAPYNVAKK